MFVLPAIPRRFNFEDGDITNVIVRNIFDWKEFFVKCKLDVLKAVAKGFVNYYMPRYSYANCELKLKHFYKIFVCVYRLVIFPMYGNNIFEISDFADQCFSL